MLTEMGLVTKQEAGRVWVQTEAKTSCNSCQVNTSCGTGIISKAFSERSFVTPMSNTLNAEVGDQVEVGIQENLVVRASFWVYLLPLLLMIIFAFVGSGMFEQSKELVQIVSAVLGLIVGFWIARLRIESMGSGKKELHPVLIRIVKKPIAVKQIETS